MTLTVWTTATSQSCVFMEENKYISWTLAVKDNWFIGSLYSALLSLHSGDSEALQRRAKFCCINMIVEVYLSFLQVQGFLELNNKKAKENLFPGLVGVNQMLLPPWLVECVLSLLYCSWEVNSVGVLFFLIIFLS